jgi:hypothetical protein
LISWCSDKVDAYRGFGGRKTFAGACYEKVFLEKDESAIPLSPPRRNQRHRGPVSFLLLYGLLKLLTTTGGTTMALLLEQQRIYDKELGRTGWGIGNWRDKKPGISVNVSVRL